MKIIKDTVVVMDYTLEVGGEVFFKTTEGHPLDYIQGEHMLLPGLEDAVYGKEEGDTFDVTLSGDMAYGESNPQKIMELPLQAFEIDGVLQKELLVVGKVVPMYDDTGRIVEATIKEVHQDKVIVDFNHPLAGKTLHITGKILSVRMATDKEIHEGLHGEFLPQKGGCGGGCHGGCSGGNCDGGDCGSGCGEDGGCCCSN